MSQQYPNSLPYGQGGARVPNALVQKGLEFANNMGLEALTALIKTLIDQQGGGIEPFIYDGEVTVVDNPDIYSSTVAVVPANIYQEMKTAFLSGRPTLLKTGNTAGDYLVIAWSPDATSTSGIGSAIEGLTVNAMSIGEVLSAPVEAIISAS